MLVCSFDVVMSDQKSQEILCWITRIVLCWYLNTRVECAVTYPDELRHPKSNFQASKYSFSICVQRKRVQFLVHFQSTFHSIVHQISTIAKLNSTWTLQILCIVIDVSHPTLHSTVNVYKTEFTAGTPLKLYSYHPIVKYIVTSMNFEIASWPIYFRAISISFHIPKYSTENIYIQKVNIKFT